MTFTSDDVTDLMYGARQVAGPRRKMRLEISSESPVPKCEIIMARVHLAGEVGPLAETQIGICLGMEAEWRKL
jgi:hypothetical protein